MLALFQSTRNIGRQEVLRIIIISETMFQEVHEYRNEINNEYRTEF